MQSVGIGLMYSTLLCHCFVENMPGVFNLAYGNARLTSSLALKRSGSQMVISSFYRLLIKY